MNASVIEIQSKAFTSCTFVTSDWDFDLGSAFSKLIAMHTVRAHCANCIVFLIFLIRMIVCESESVCHGLEENRRLNELNLNLRKEARKKCIQTTTPT